MAKWHFKLETDDNTSTNFNLDNLNNGFTLKLRERNESELSVPLNDIDNNLKTKLTLGNEIRLYTERIAFTNITGVWHFEDNAKDESGNGNDGTITGATFVTGKVGKALKFNGSADYVTMANEANFDFERTDPFTISMWVKTTTTTNMILVAKLDVGPTFRGYQLSISSDITDDITIHIINDNTTTTRIKVRTVATTITDGNWHNIVFTYDGSGAASGCKFYFDKVLQSTVIVNDALGANTILNNIAFRVATREDLGAKWNGDLDEVRVYKRELTQTEINDLFDSKNTKTKIFTGTILTKDRFYTEFDSYGIFAKNNFKDSIQSSRVNKKFIDQKVDVTVKDIIQNFLNKTFTVTGVEVSDISQPYNAIKENAEHLLDRIANSSFSEYFATPDNDVTWRHRETGDSGLTIADSNIVNISTVTEKRSILESFGIIEVVGGKSSETFDLNERVIAQAVIGGAAANFKDRVFTKIDERFTTWKGAKEHALTLAEDFGKEFLLLPPLDIRDLFALPQPGEFIRVNSTRMGLDQRFVVTELEIIARSHTDAVELITLVLGDTEQSERKKLRLLKEIFEDEKRKDLDVDVVTAQRAFSITMKKADTLLLEIRRRSKLTNPWNWENGVDDGTDPKKNDSRWSFFSWDDGA